MQKNIKTICVICFVLLMCMSFVLAACDTATDVEITSIKLDKNTLSLKVGDEATLTATVEPAQQAKDIVWTVNKEGIVTVDGGKVKAIAAGTAVVSAQNKSGTVYDSCTIVVEAKVNSVTLDKKTLELTVGEEDTLVATVDPTTSASNLVWKCEPQGVVKVVGGKVTALTAGKATVTVTDLSGEKSDSCTVTVYETATEITLGKQSVGLTVGDEETLVATIVPQGTKAAVFTSSDETVATVDKNGKIVAVKAGTATITATVGKLSASCEVTVYNKVTAITLDVETLAMYSGETHALVVTTTPAEAIRKATFATLDQNVATVDANGVITAVGGGTTTITATIDDVTANVTVNVIRVAFEQQNYSLALNAEQQLALTFDPASATEANVNYVSSAADAVSVDGEGKVKALAYGQATITASVEGKFSATCTVTVSPLATNNGVTVEYGDGYAIKTLAGVNVNALNLGANAASKVYYAEYTLNGMNLFDNQAKTFGLVHFATNDNLMFDVFHMFLGGGNNNDAAAAGYWHRMNNKLDLENDLLVNAANRELGAVQTWLIDMLQNGKSITMGIARNGNDVYTLLNGVIVWKTQIAAGLADVDTLPAIFMNSTPDDARTITDIVYLNGDAAAKKIADSEMLIKSLQLGETKLTLTKDEQKTLTATVDPTYAASKLVWESSNTEVVTVENGVIKAIKAGFATVTAKIGNTKAEVVVTVVDFRFEQQNYSFAPSSTEKLNLVFGEGSDEGQTAAYRSSNDSIVSIDADGIITAKTYGRVTITATVKGVSVECTVTISPLVTSNGVNVEYDEDGSYKNTIAITSGNETVNAINTGLQASKLYYAEYTLNGLYINDGQYKAFGMAHLGGDTFMFDKYSMYLGGGNNNNAAAAGYWHRMAVGYGVADENLMLNHFGDVFGVSKDWLVQAATNHSAIKIGIARSGNYIYTFVNDVIVLQTNIADALKDVNTTPALYLQAIGDSSITISDVSFLDGEAVTNKINGATRLLHYSRVADNNYKPVTIAADSSSFRFNGVDGLDSAWRASVTQEVVFGVNATIEMDVAVHNSANGHIGINIAKNYGDGWTDKNNFSDGLTLAGYWMWTNGGKQQGVDYFKDGATGWNDNVDKFWCGGPAEENKSGNFHIKIDLTRNEDGTVKSVMTISNGETIMQVVEKTSDNTHGADEMYRIHFLSHAIDYEVSNLTVVGK